MFRWLYEFLTYEEVHPFWQEMINAGIVKGAK